MSLAVIVLSQTPEDDLRSKRKNSSSISSEVHALVSPGPGAPPALPPTASSTPPPSSSSSSSSSEPGSSISSSHHHHHHRHQHQHQQLSSVPSSVSSVAFSSFLKCCCLRRASVAPRLQSFMAITANVVSSEVWEQNKKYTVYKIVVKYDSHTWIIHRRYNEFSKLCDLLKKLYPHLHLKLPGKKLFGNNFSSDFIKTRRQALDTLVQRVLGEPQVLDVAEVRTFFQLDRTLKNSVEDDDDHEDASMTITSNSSEKMINLGPSEKPSVKPSDFEFLRTIGKGSFGKVFSARHKKEDTIYAIKVLNKKMILKRNEKNHIMSERNVLLKNLNHPFLVGLYYSFQTKDKLYFVLDYVNGGELFFHLSKERLFTEPRARFYAAEITSAIGYLHSQGIIYRDLKPENILLDSDGHIILTDFGLCKEGLRERETTNTFCGTPEYLAPEVLRKEPYDRCVDWWCLGAVLYEMLNSLPPFYSRDNAEMYDNILHKPVRFRANMSTAARNILELLLQKDKRKRLGAIEDADEIKRHEFFRPINWADLESKSIPPPFNPNVKDNLDMRNIDPEFVREAIPNSVIKSQGMGASSLGDNVFQGFSYAPVHNHNLGY